VIARREFTKAVKLEIIKRAMALGHGTIACEGCGAPTLGKFEIHHRDMDAMQVDKSRRLTARDGVLLCLPCHDGETAKQAPVLAEAKRREASHLGARRRPKQPLKSGGTLKGPERAHENRQSLSFPTGIARQYKDAQ